MPDAPKDTAAIKDYHAHVYYDRSSKERAAQLRQWVEDRFAGRMRMGSWHDEPVGPHVQAMYQIAFPPELFPTLVPFLMLNRMGLAVLVHPQSGRPRDDHTLNAMRILRKPFQFTQMLAEVNWCLRRGPLNEAA